MHPERPRRPPGRRRAAEAGRLWKLIRTSLPRNVPVDRISVCGDHGVWPRVEGDWVAGKPCRGLPAVADPLQPCTPKPEGPDRLPSLWGTVGTCLSE